MPEFVNPKQVLGQVGITQDMVAADFGCGSGGWVIPLAGMLKDGIIYAIDLQESALSAITSRAKLQGFSNIKRVSANVETEIKEIEKESCDLVLITDLLFQVDEKDQVFIEASRVLKTGGKLLVVEWNVDSPLGPQAGKVSAEEIKQIADRIGIKLKKEFKAGDYHFALIFNK